MQLIFVITPVCLCHQAVLFLPAIGGDLFHSFSGKVTACLVESNGGLPTGS